MTRDKFKAQVLERKNARGRERKVWDVYHLGCSDVSILEIVAHGNGLAIYDTDGNQVVFVPTLKGGK